MEKVFIVIGTTVGIIFCIAGIGLLLAFPIKWTWNATMPCLFSWPVITWGKAWCLHFICSCLVKSSLTSTK